MTLGAAHGWTVSQGAHGWDWGVFHGTTKTLGTGTSREDATRQAQAALAALREQAREVRTVRPEVEA